MNHEIYSLAAAHVAQYSPETSRALIDMPVKTLDELILKASVLYTDRMIGDDAILGALGMLHRDIEALGNPDLLAELRAVQVRELGPEWSLRVLLDRLAFVAGVRDIASRRRAMQVAA